MYPHGNILSMYLSLSEKNKARCRTGCIENN